MSDAPLPVPQTFADLGLPEPLLKAITEEGYELPTPIQARAIPLLLSGHDMIGQAQTGTGKTCAFALPMLNAVDTGKHAVQALVLCPTRELALQVAGSVFTYGKHLARVSTLAVYGGESMFHQLGRLSKGVHVVVGTPGRVLDHIRRGSLKLDAVRFMVLDEADEMLRMGFIDDVEEILSHTPATRQTALFSATLPPRIASIAQRQLRDPVMVKIECPICAKPGTLVLIKLRAPAPGNARSRCGGSCLSGKISCDCQCMGRCHGAGTCKCGDPIVARPVHV